MKKTLLVLGTALVVVLLLPAWVGAAPRVTEYERQQNVPTKREGTHQSRSAERKAKRAEVKAENRNDEIPNDGEDWGSNGNVPPAVSGTKASRSAERKENRAEVKELERSGEFPITNEAVVNQPAKAR
jgi:hypothetical protein